jgi:AcrR family transcriptional regulator
MAATQQRRAPYRETKRLKAEHRRRLILDATRVILVEQGYSKLALRVVAENAGIRLATLQYYFPTSEALFQAAFRDIADSVWNELIELTEIHDSADPQKRLRSFLRGIHASTKDRALAGFFSELWARARIDAYAAEIMSEYYGEAINLLAQLISDCRSTKSPGESQRRATMLIAMLEGMTILNFAVHNKSGPLAVSDRYAVSNMLKLAIQD